MDTLDLFSSGDITREELGLEGLSDGDLFSHLDISLFDALLADDDPSMATTTEAIAAAKDEDDEDDESKPCLVCGNDAGKHSYYGGQVCNSCRAFFRRAIVGNSHPDFKCTATGAADQLGGCKINSKSRKSCQFCRFQSCLRAGMQPKWIMSDSEVSVRRERRIILQKVRREKRQQQQVQTTLNLKESTLGDTYTMAELDEVKEMTRQTLDYAYYHLAKFYAKHQTVHQDVLTAIHQGSSLSFTTLKMLDKYVHNICIGLYMSLSETKRLPLDDARELVVCNFPLVVSYLHSIFVSPVDAKSTRRQFLDRVLREADQDEDLGKVAAKISTVNPDMTDDALSYEQMFATPWACNEFKEQHHESATRKMQAWLPRASDEQPRDDVPFVLLFYILLFSTEFLYLQSPKEAEAIQLKYMYKMHRYLKFKYPKRALTMFVDGMLIISFAREAQDIRRKRLPV